MNLNKHISFFDPSTITCPIHIIGCGAIGSRIAELLVRLGTDNLVLWDFDKVEPHNIPNQLFRHIDIGKTKTEALASILRDINPTVNLKLKEKYEGHNITGHVFLCVDSINLRREIATANKDNENIKTMFDARMRLTDAQSYGADWTKTEDIEAFINTMQFTDEEASEATPVSACGTTLSVVPTVCMVASVTVTNWMNSIISNDIKRIILVDAFTYNTNAF